MGVSTPMMRLNNVERRKSGGNFKVEIKDRIIDEVEKTYIWIDKQIIANVAEKNRCDGCGRCCDFGKFGHKLYITSPELMYFRAKIGTDNFKSMPTGVCPYQINNKCTAHEHRFAGCRIFFCKADEDFQSRLSEEAILKLKEICKKENLPYEYTELASSLNAIASDID